MLITVYFNKSQDSILIKNKSKYQSNLCCQICFCDLEVQITSGVYTACIIVH